MRGTTQLEEFAFNLREDWYKWSAYELVKGFIKPTKGATIIRYNPFDFFTDTLDFKRKKGLRPLNERHIHATFATLDPNNTDEILRWVTAFGIPFSMHIDKDGGYRRNFPHIINSHDIVDMVRLTDLAGAIETYKTVINVYNAVQSGLEEDLQYILGVVSTRSFYNYYQYLEQQTRSVVPSEAHDKVGMDALEELWDITPAYTGNLEDYDVSRDLIDECGGIVGLAKSYITRMLNHATQSVKEAHLFEENQLKIGWEYGSLLALLYKMLSLDWSKGKNVRKCDNLYCQEFYIPYSPTALYCSDVCSNRGRQQTYRKDNREKLANYRKEYRKKEKEKALEAKKAKQAPAK
jgi:hypothetical protein